MLQGEDHLGPAGAELATALGAAGLHDDRVTLGGARGGERAAGADPFSFVVDVVDLGGIGEGAGGLVEQQGAVVPTVPQGEAGLEHLVGAVVAGGAARHLVHAEIAGFQRAGGGDHVPGGAAGAEMVERAEHAGDLVRVVEGGGVGEAKADVFGDAGHHGEDDGRVEQADLAAAADHGVEAPIIEVVEAEDVGEEQAVEASSLEHAGDVLVAGRVEDVVDGGFRVAPGAVVVAGRAGHEKGDEVHLVVAHSPSLEAVWGGGCK